MAIQTILVAGATGRQGRAFIDALKPGSENETTFHILALTRNAAGPMAKGLASLPYVTVVEGDLTVAATIRKIFDEKREIWGVFCVLEYPGLGASAEGEETQGKMLADLSLEFGVSLFVYSSAERGGEIDDDNFVLDRLAKVRIERYIRQLGEKGLPWTILRPGFFMENYEGFFGALTVGVLKVGLKPSTTIQLVSINDIGCVAAAVFKNPDHYQSQILLVAGEASTVTKQMEDYRRVTGRPMPSFGILARGLITLNKHVRDLIQDLERIHSRHLAGETPETDAQTAMAKSAYEGMQTFSGWVENQKTNPVEKRKSGWNAVTIKQLLLRRN